MFKQLIVFYTIFNLVICHTTRASDRSPAVKPAGWVADTFDDGLTEYLQSQYVYAKDNGLEPYVYVYSDRNEHCRSIRSLMKRQDMQEAFSNTHVVMLNHFDLRDLDKENGKKNDVLFKNFTPIIVRISAGGRLIGAVMKPELYLYYPLATNEPELRNYSIQYKRQGPIPKGVFAKQMKKYFDANHEIYSSEPR